MLARTLLAFAVLALLAGCSARQVAGKLPGAQEQRLITHALDDLMTALPAEDFEPRRGSRVLVEPLAIADGAPLNYAVKRLQTELAHRYDLKIVDQAGQADFILRVFFTALGTDHDKAGFSIPLIAVPDAQYTSDLDLLAVDMYHGVAELYYYIVSPDGGVLSRSASLLARERIDKLGTPIFTIPINSID